MVAGVPRRVVEGNSHTTRINLYQADVWPFGSVLFEGRDETQGLVCARVPTSAY